MIASQIDRLRRQVNFSQTFLSLRYPNYRLWFWGQLVSLFGTWMQMTAQGFLIYQLTGSPAYLGYLGFAAGVPSWLLMPFGGVIADRVRRKTLLLITQTSMMILASALAALTFGGWIRAWHLLGFAFLLGVANAFDAPARHAFVPEIVGPEDLTNAIALNSTMFNSAAVVGPAIAGVFYALFGPGWCFTINAISFLAIIAALGMMKLAAVPRAESTSTALQDLKEGFRYVLAQPTIRTLISLVLITSLFGVSFAALFPAWAVEILHGNAATNGWLQSARGAGALIGSLLIASLGRFDFRGKLLFLGFFSFPILLVAFAFIRSLPLSLIVLVGNGVAGILIFNLANALVQSLVKESLRGRVMGIYSLTFFGFLPIGALWVGMIAEHFGERTAVLGNAAIMLFSALIIVRFVPGLRRIR